MNVSKIDIGKCDDCTTLEVQLTKKELEIISSAVNSEIISVDDRIHSCISGNIYSFAKKLCDYADEVNELLKALRDIEQYVITEKDKPF